MDGFEVTEQDLELTRDQIVEALKYCSSLKCIQSSESLPFCQHCSLFGESAEYLKDVAFQQFKVPSSVKKNSQGDWEHNWLTAADLLNKI